MAESDPRFRLSGLKDELDGPCKLSSVSSCFTLMGGKVNEDRRPREPDADPAACPCEVADPDPERLSMNLARRLRKQPVKVVDRPYKRYPNPAIHFYEAIRWTGSKIDDPILDQ